MSAITLPEALASLTDTDGAEEGRPSLPPFPADRPSPSLSSNIGPTCRVRRRGGEWVFKSSPQKKLPEGSKNKAIRKVPQPARTMRRTACPKEQFSPRYGWNFVGLPPSGSLDVAREAECLGITTNLMGGGRGLRREAYRKHFLWAANRRVVIPAQLRWSRRRRRPK